MTGKIRCAFDLDPTHAASAPESMAIASDANPDAEESTPSSTSTMIACHAHFSGDIARVPRAIASRVFSTANDVFVFELPRDLENEGNADRRGDRGDWGGSEGGYPPLDALRVTLVHKFRGGWLRHSRVRIPLDALGASPKRFDLKNEQLDEKPYGTVTASWVDEPFVPGETIIGGGEAASEVYREWFFVPEFAREVVSNANAASRWFDGKTPTATRCEWPDGWSGGELNGRVHMPLWNNQTGSIPGSFFAFSCRRDASRYSKEDLEDVFCVGARPLVGGTTCDDANRPRFRGEWLATGLMIFGKSLQYQGDRTVDSPQVIERFSSTARLDGLGDCEDIAKETAMAHADLVATETAWTRAEKITQTCVEMCALVNEAKKYVCAIALCTVRRSRGSRIEAHAFAMLLPKCAFSDCGGAGTARSAFVADGTYPCDPSSNNVPEEGVRPWKYEHVVSALVYGEGEIYFRYRREPTNYGVLADDLFPSVSEEVVIEWGYRVRDQKDRDGIERVLASNLPTTTRTFQHEDETVSRRFRKLARLRDVDVDAKKIFAHATPEEKRRIRIASAGFRTSCPSRETFDARLRLTEERREHAGDVDTPRDEKHHAVGGYGSVPTVNGVVNPFHTHHRPQGHSAYLDHNPPTPDDVATFVAGRAAGLVVLARGSEREKREIEGKIQATSTVITRNNRYEMSMAVDRPDDAVSVLWWKGMTDGELRELKDFESLMNAFVPLAMRAARNAVVGEGKWVKYEGGGPTLVVDITKKKNEHDRYLEAYEKSMGVRVSYLPVDGYKRRCELD